MNDDRTHTGRDSGRQPLPPDRSRGDDDRTHAVPPNPPSPPRPSARLTASSTNNRPTGSYNTSSSGEWTRRVRVGAQLAEYVLEKELGEGGMGSVFVARHVATGQEVALKVMLVDPDVNQAALERFRREGQAQAAAGKHPNVLLVHTAGEEAGCAYLVMELAPGGDLKARLKKGPVEPKPAAALVAALARGLAHVHAQGVLHRDLKPGNVVFGADGTPKLMDFGLARLKGADKLTQTGTMLGTPAYMAPEQAGGETLDERADVYALGAVLYHCLTGRPPFDGSAMAIVRKVLTEKPTPPREVEPTIPRSLDQLVMRTLAKDADQRFQTATALAVQLERFAKGELEEPPRRGRLVAACAGVLLLGIAAAAALAIHQAGGGDVAAVDTGNAPSTSTSKTRPAAPAVSLRGPTEAWSIVDGDVSELTIDGSATGAAVEVRAGDPGEALQLVATSLPARVPLRVGWTQIVVRASAPGARAAVERRDVVRLRAGLRRLNDGQAENTRDGSTLVLVPPGDVLMEEDLMKPTGVLTKKRIERPFFIGLYEVTWGQFRAHAAATGAELPPHETPEALGRVPGDRDPVYNVIWDEIDAYCKWAGLRTPTADEWIYAACGEDASKYPWGDTPVPGTKEWLDAPLANLDAGDTFPFVAPVGSFEGGRSRFGVHDMFGNVWEYVDPYMTREGVRWFFTFGSGWTNKDRVLRDAASEEMLKRGTNNGMRVAADVDPPP